MKRVSVPKNVILAIVGIAQLMDILDTCVPQLNASLVMRI
jgi:hypothetical protein